MSRRFLYLSISWPVFLYRRGVKSDGKNTAMTFPNTVIWRYCSALCCCTAFDCPVLSRSAVLGSLLCGSELPRTVPTWLLLHRSRLPCAGPLCRLELAAVRLSVAAYCADLAAAAQLSTAVCWPAVQTWLAAVRLSIAACCSVQTVLSPSRLVHSNLTALHLPGAKFTMAPLRFVSAISCSHWSDLPGPVLGPSLARRTHCAPTSLVPNSLWLPLGALAQSMFIPRVNCILSSSSVRYRDPEDNIKL